MIRGAITPAGDTPPKGVPLKRLLAKTQKVYVHFTKFLGSTFSGPVVPDICSELRVQLGLTYNEMPPLRCSLEEMLEPQQILTKMVLKMIILKMLQNKEYLLRDETIPRWVGSPPVWTILKVEDVLTVHIREKPFTRLSTRALSGVMAGEPHQILLPIKYVRWLTKEMGYPRYEKAHEREIVGMLSWVRMETSKTGRTTIGKVKPTSGQETYNRKLANARLNKDCEFKTRSCYNCPLGLDKCGLATRLKTKENVNEQSSSTGP